MEQRVARLDYEIFNGGQKGLSTKVDDLIATVGNFMAAHQAREKAQEEAERIKEKNEAILEREKVEAAKARRWRIGIIVTVGSTVLAVVLAWLLSILIPAAKAVMDDYYQRHPAALIQHSLSSPSPPAYAVDKPQDAKIPTLVR